MAYGVQIFDASGNTVLDTTDTVGFIKASYTGSIAGGGTVNLTVPAKTAGDEVLDNTYYTAGRLGTLTCQYTTSTNIQIKSTFSGTQSYRVIILYRGY